jgi:hypothetical protein
VHHDKAEHHQQRDRGRDDCVQIKVHHAEPTAWITISFIKSTVNEFKFKPSTALAALHRYRTGRWDRTRLWRL